MRRLLRAGMFAIASGAGAAVAQSAGDAGGRALENLVRQKEALVRRVLVDLPSHGPSDSGQPKDALRMIDAAASSHKAAVGALDAGDWAAADRRLNDAMRSIRSARQLSPDPAAEAAAAEARYRRNLAAVESLLDAFRRREMTQSGGTTTAERIARDVESARREAGDGRIAEALTTLGRVELELLAALNRVLGSKTIEYVQRFESAEEEFAFELERNRSYSELVPIAVSALRPTSGAQRLIERFVRQGRSRLDEAHEAANRGRWAAAVAKTREATLYLQRALTISGLVLPAEALADEED